MEKAIEAQGLTKVFGWFGKKIIAVDSLEMSIDSGTIHGFIGPNGAGKTTTIKMLIGAIKPTRGKAFIFGEAAGSVRAKAFIGYSPEHPDFYSMSALEFLVYNGELCGLKQGEAKKRGKELLDWLGLSDFADKNARKFSAGMKQKLSLAQALIHDPDVLILDEPTANLDPIGRYEVLEKIAELAKKQKKTVFVSSHILLELEKIVDHVTIINKGKVILQSEINDLRKRFSERHFIINTKNNQNYLKSIQALQGAENAWINHEMKIEVLVKDSTRFKKAVIEMFRGKEDELIELLPLRMSLENIFLKVMGRETE
ncbi:MAG: ABC transporter ATP-binding protein [Candidatus Aenigmatarchaeota archaeon]|nr:MAG: ABC transporter ATP-binding protein [Candidatus Aenigmarchaeota archaeon]